MSDRTKRVVPLAATLSHPLIIAQAEAPSQERSTGTQPLEQERMSSYTDDAFECESPHALLASNCGLPLEQRSDDQTPETESAYVAVDTTSRARVESIGGQEDYGDVAYGELAQPRPEIILRWKRFALLVVLVAAVMSAIAAWLRKGFVVDKNIPVSKAESEADTVNSYIGLMMGFIETFVGLGVEEIFPVFVVYMHNLRWYPGDDPATKKQSKFKKFALTIFIPAVMMAVGSSLSAIQANQKDNSTDSTNAAHPSTTTTRFLMTEVSELEAHGLGNTILKAALARKVEPMPPLEMSLCNPHERETFTAASVLAAAPKAVFGFPLPTWGVEFGNKWSRREPTKHYEVSLPSTAKMDETSQLTDVMPLALAHELWTEGEAVLQSSVRAVESIRKSPSPSNVDELLNDILTSLVRMDVPLNNSPAVSASFHHFDLDSFMTLDVMSLKLPLRSPTNASVVCGKSRCALWNSERQTGLPRKQIGMTQMKSSCSQSDECAELSNAVFLYGFTIVSSGEVETAGSTRSLIISFARVSWQYESVANECDPKDENDCQILSYQLGNSNRRLVLSKQDLPAQLKRGRLASPISLVQLLEPKIKHINQAQSLGTLEYLDSWPQASQRACSRVVDTFLHYVNSNHFFMGSDLVETMTASALLFLFQDARVVRNAPSEEIVRTQRRLATTTTRRVKIFLTNTWIGNLCTWTACGVLLLLTALVFLLPNERARLSPPRGGNARAERFVAVQTEQVYPNLIYKKRFLIGKTGEEIKFGEFAVESVGLHHKMEEDEQIYI